MDFAGDHIVVPLDNPHDTDNAPFFDRTVGEIPTERGRAREIRREKKRARGEIRREKERGRGRDKVRRINRGTRHQRRSGNPVRLGSPAPSPSPSVGAK
ncbi:hypothetical protein ACLOJK_007973 [Asimina triloba]